MQEKGLAKMDATVTSTSLEALGLLLRAQICTLLESLPESLIVPKTTSTSGGSLKPIQVKYWGQWRYNCPTKRSPFL